jgi:DNA-binding CsgD family transcriptional regulator
VRTGELRPNEAARSVLAEVVDAEEHLVQLLSRKPGDGRFGRRAEVLLRSGEEGVLHASSQLTTEGQLVTVVELQREVPGLDRRLLAPLTPREGEVAVLIVEGLSDREIAERLSLSRYTVQQYVKRIYRALEVDSRVGLTRLLLGAPAGSRRS